MALTVSLTMPPAANPDVPGEMLEPVVYPAAYARIVGVRAHKDISFLVMSWHADQEARDNDAQPVLLKELFTDTANLVGDIYPAAYAYLKTLPEFAGAIDC